MVQDHLKLPPLPVADWPATLEHVIADMQGRPLNVHALMAHHPELLQAWWPFRNHVVGGGSLGRRLAELVILRVAGHLQSWYEWGSHVERALACGLTLAEVERVRQGTQAPGWAAEEALLLKAVDELIAGHAISQPTLADLYQHYSARQVLDLIAIQGMYVLLGCMINTWDLPLDDQVQEKLPAAVTREAFEAGLSQG